jgi:hypothetical protein
MYCKLLCCIIRHERPAPCPEIDARVDTFKARLNEILSRIQGTSSQPCNPGATSAQSCLHARFPGYQSPPTPSPDPDGMSTAR